MSRVDEQAAAWFLRMREAAPDDPDRGRFEAWLLGSPAHAEAYAVQLDLWGRFDRAADIDALADVLERRREAARQGRRRSLKLGGLALLFAGSGGFLYRQWRDEPLWQSAFDTGIAQTANQALPDGSTLVLGAGTALRVAFSRGERKAWLARGEVIFDVARDADRPFVIDGGLGRITVLGTRFVVTRFAARLRVSVAHGRVQLATGYFWDRRLLVLGDGEVAEIAEAAAGTTPPRRLDRPAADAFAFEHGEIVFDGASLGEIAETLSRYRTRPVRVGPGAENVRPLTAVMQLSRIEDFLRSLPRIFPVILTEQPDGTLLSGRR